MKQLQADGVGRVSSKACFILSSRDVGERDARQRVELSINTINNAAQIITTKHRTTA